MSQDAVTREINKVYKNLQDNLQDVHSFTTTRPITSIVFEQGTIDSHSGKDIEIAIPNLPSTNDRITKGVRTDYLLVHRGDVIKITGDYQFCVYMYNSNEEKTYKGIVGGINYPQYLRTWVSPYYGYVRLIITSYSSEEYWTNWDSLKVLSNSNVQSEKPLYIGANYTIMKKYDNLWLNRDYYEHGGIYF